MSRSLILACLLAVRAMAQVASCELFGDVRDQAGGGIPGAAVTAAGAATGFSRSAAADDQGRYRIAQLPPDVYEITVNKPGFQATRTRSVALTVNQHARLDFELAVAGGNETVTVTADVSPVQTEDASEGYVLDQATVKALPLAARNVISLVTLGPGAIPRQLGGFVHDVVNDVQEGARGAVALNPPINGTRSTMNAFLLDGAYDTDRNTNAIAVYPPMESVREFRIQTSLAPADFPQTGGGAIDVVTRSGGRQFHGSAFEYLRNEATDARNFFDDPALPRPIFRQNQFGGSLSGPLPLRRTFFFATYEGLRGKAGNSSLNIVPDASLRAGDFTGRNAVYDPLSAAGARLLFPANSLPASRIDPVALRYLARYEPLPNRSSDASNYLDATPNENRANSVSGRIDHQFSDQSTLNARYTLNQDSNRVAGAFPVLPTAETLRAQQTALGYTLARPGWVNQARVSFTRLRTFDLPESAFRSNVAADLGLSDSPDNPRNFGLPLFLVTNLSMVTDSPTLPQLQRDSTWHVADSVSFGWRGSHTLKTGFEWVHFHLNYLQSRLARGQYTYTGAFTSADGRPEATGDAFADFLLGYPQDTSRSVGPTQAYLRQNSYAVFFRDDWKVSSNLTLNLGVRYEYASPFHEARGALQNLVYAGAAPPALVPGETAVDPDRNNFAPRAGLALRLPHFGRQTVFRAGYGIFFSPELSIETYDLVLNGIRNEINATNGALPPVLTTADAFPRTASTGFPTYFGLDRGARTPYVQQWIGDLQYELPGRILLDVAYIGTKGTRLGRFRQFNTPLHVETGENLDPRPGDLQSLRPFPELGMIIQRQHIANSIYHSLQVKAEKRLSARLTFLGSFVWSKSIDDADSVIPGQYDSIGAQDERNLRLERGLSFFDVRKRVSAGVVSALPSPRLFNTALRNWQVSAVVTLQDGTPLNPVYFAFDPANTGTPNRPDVVAGQSVQLPRDQRTADRFFNTDAFSAPAPYHFGNAGRNILPGPGNNVFDFALRRRFTVREGHSIEFRVESFNTFNHPNWGIPGPYPDFGPFFGKIFTTGDPRRMQGALRYEF